MKQNQLFYSEKRGKDERGKYLMHIFFQRLIRVYQQIDTFKDNSGFRKTHRLYLSLKILA